MNSIEINNTTWTKVADFETARIQVTQGGHVCVHIGTTDPSDDAPYFILRLYEFYDHNDPGKSVWVKLFNYHNHPTNTGSVNKL